MSPCQRRFRNVIARIGDTFTRGAGSYRGLFAIVPADQHATYLTPTELGTCALPVRLAYVPFDDAAAPGDTVIWNGLSLDVKRAVAVSHADEVVVKLLVLG